MTMIGVFKFLAVLFGLLALAALGHDVWRAVSIQNKFTLSEVGGLFQHYAPAAHDSFRKVIATTFGVQTFNLIFVPVLSLYTLLLAGGLSAFFAGLMLLLLRRQNKHLTGHRKFRHRPNH
jgi:hypothetical protein